MIRITKDGEWAVGGVDVLMLAKGEKRDFGPKENAELVKAGWAQHVEHEPAADPEGKGKEVGRQQGQRAGGSKSGNG
ncbi:hypothetical protein [Lysobacter sp. GCM10012299]|uniref:hypothetical protein n=1 Tax=Lysobacter sp. GCM10012299 TaxID=3317333 RepID=UPI0036060845